MTCTSEQSEGSSSFLQAAITEPAEAANTADDELQQQYLVEFERQYREHLEKMAAENNVAKEEKPEVKEEAVPEDAGEWLLV